MQWKDLSDSLREPLFRRSALSILWKAILLTAAALGAASTAAYALDWLRAKGFPGTGFIGSPGEWASRWTLAQWSIVALAILCLSILACAAHLVHVAARAASAPPAAPAPLQPPPPERRRATPDDRLHAFKARLDVLIPYAKRMVYTDTNSPETLKASNELGQLVEALLRYALTEEFRVAESIKYGDTMSRGQAVGRQADGSWLVMTGPIFDRNAEYLAGLRKRVTADMMRLDVPPVTPGWVLEDSEAPAKGAEGDPSNA